MLSTPLKYRISDWHQLVDVRSNNSRDLYLSVTDYLQDDRLHGLRIQVKHTLFGVMFAIVINSTGTILSDITHEEAYTMTTDQILTELERWGFYVDYAPAKHLPESQLVFLETLRGLKYDKLRILNVYRYENTTKLYKWHIVVFNVEQNPEWINNTYSASLKEYMKALQSGSVVNVSEASLQNNWDWSWLDYVANIDDILRDNGREV